MQIFPSQAEKEALNDLTGSVVNCTTRSRKVSLFPLNSSIFLSTGALKQLPHVIKKAIKNSSKCLIVSDTTVYPLYGEPLKEQLTTSNIPTYHILIPPGEQSKTMECAAHCWMQMHKLGMDRKSLLIGLGGGVVTDISGFLAACYMRGVETIHIPTTLIGMVDAAIGGKTGVNLPTGKNIVGAFHQPTAIVIDTSLLKTLPLRHIRSGAAEIIKYGMIRSPSLFKFLEENIKEVLKHNPEVIDHVVEKSCRIKTKFVIQDEKSLLSRNLLNWGHTFAHAIEAATNYTTYLHGEAVAIGMSCAAHLSYQLGTTDRELLDRQDSLCQKAGLPIQLPNIPLNKIIDLMIKDKKATHNKLSFIIAHKIGKVSQAHNIHKKDVLHALHTKQQEDLS